MDRAERGYPITTTTAVTDNAWHHAVLVVAPSGQTLYLDNAVVGSLVSAGIEHRGADQSFIGTGKLTAGWPGGPAGTGNAGFTGQIDDVAFYRHPLAATDIGEHYAARTATNRLATGVEPGSFTATSVTYDQVTGRVGSQVDRNGATWNLTAPLVGTNERTVNITGPRTIVYTYDSQHNGRLSKRAEAGGTRAWSYDDNGFVSATADENGDTISYINDARGNVTQRTTCRDVNDCHSEYFGYYLNPNDKFDPRNDVQVSSADARSSGPSDTTYRTTRDLDASGQVTRITYPIPSGQSTQPTETFSYTTRPYTLTTQFRTFVPADQTVLTLGNNATQQVTLPFPVSFWGQTYTSAWVSENGLLAFNSTGAQSWATTDLPNPNNPNAVLYPFWSDINLQAADSSARTAVLGTAPNRQFVIEWRNAHGCCPGTQNAMSIEIVLSESGEIAFNYTGIDIAWERGALATVGIESPTGCDAMRYSFNEQVLADNTAVIYTPVPAWTGAPAGLLASRTGRSGGVTSNSYNTAGDLVSTTDPVGLVTTNSYDRLGRLATSHPTATIGGQPADYGTTSYTYNGLSEPTTITAPGVLNPITAVTHTQRTTYDYDDLGRRTKQDIADTTGGELTRTTQWTYDPAGRLTTTTNPDGSHTDQLWNSAGDIVQATLPTGLVLDFTYDYAHRNTQTRRDGDAVALESRGYDPAGRLTAVTDGMGRTTTYTYYHDSLPKQTARVIGTGTPPPVLVIESRMYDAAGNVTTLTTPGPNIAGAVTTTTFTYDPAGNPITQTLDPTGLNRTTANSYNADSSITTTLSSGALAGPPDQVDYAYDAAGRLLTTTVDTTGLNLTTTVVRDPRGLVTRQTDPSGVATDYSYDLAGQLLTSTGAARTTWINGVAHTGISPVTTTGRDTFGEPTQQRDPNDGVTTTGYDGMGRTTTVTRPSYTPPGGTAITATTSTGYTYNAQGLLVTTTDALGNLSSSQYDQFGRLITKTEPDPDGAGPKTAAVWTYEYDHAGEPTTTTDPTGAKITDVYDTHFPRKSMTSQSEAHAIIWWNTTFGYDDAGNRTTSTSPLGHTTTTYDAAHEPTKVTDPTGRFTQTSYDLAGRIVSTAKGQGTTYANPVAATVYDHAGRAVSTSDCTSTATGTCATALRTTSTVYDAAGRVTQTTTGEGRPTFYGYDGAGQLSTVAQRVDPANPATAIVVSLGYDAAGNKTRMVDGNANATSYTYTPWNLPESTIEPATPTHPADADRTWTTVYDADGNPVQDQLPGGVTRGRSYDHLGRLTAETGTGWPRRSARPGRSPATGRWWWGEPSHARAGLDEHIRGPVVG